MQIANLYPSIGYRIIPLPEGIGGITGTDLAYYLGRNLVASPKLPATLLLFSALPSICQGQGVCESPSVPGHLLRLGSHLLDPSGHHTTSGALARLQRFPSLNTTRSSDGDER